MNKPAPIKRDPALVRFSKDHHHGLLLVWKIREGFRLDVERRRIAEYVVWFFDNELVPHFEDEEKNLLPRLPEGDHMRSRVLTEHETMKDLVSVFRRGEQGEDDLRKFASLLEGHIRFEERELFNRLQESLDKKELEEILNAHDAGVCKSTNVWQDEFWK